MATTPPLTTSVRACIQCRARKVKCTDGVSHGQACHSCERLGFNCSRTETSRMVDGRRSSILDIQRKRITKACTACRAQKAKCTGETPCRRCATRHITCEYAQSKRKLQNSLQYDRISATITATSEVGVLARESTILQREGSSKSVTVIDTVPMNTDTIVNTEQRRVNHGRSEEVGRKAGPHGSATDFCLGLEESIIQHYIDSFFRLVYPISYLSFLHQASFMREWHTKTIELPLLKAVCACAISFTGTDSEEIQRSRIWIRDTEKYVLQTLGELSIAQLQMLLLLIFYHSKIRHTRKVWMLSALVARLAFAMRLNYEHDSLPPVLQESRRRLMWSIFIVDKFYSGGMPELTLCAEENMHIRLPCNERSFAFGISSDSPRLNEAIESREMGILAYYIRLLNIRHKILRSTKHVIAGNRTLWEFRFEVRDLEQELIDFENSLPAEYRWTPENLLLRAYSANLTSFVMLHTFWHQCHCDLYRLPLRGIKEAISDQALKDTPAEYASNLSTHCLNSALKLARLWSEVVDLGLDNPVKDSSISGCAFQCVKIVGSLQHIDISNTNTSTQMSSMEVIKVCLKILQDLRLEYPVVEEVYRDIRGIQDNLRNPKISQSKSTELSALLQDTSPLPMMSRHSVLAHAQAEPSQRGEAPDESNDSSSIDEDLSDQPNNQQGYNMLETTHPESTTETIYPTFGSNSIASFGDITGLFDIDGTWNLGRLDAEAHIDPSLDYPDVMPALFPGWT